MSTLTVWLEHIGVPAVFGLVLIEQIGLPLPSYPLLIVAGAWSANGGAPLARIALAAVVACLLADLGWHATGRRFGSRVLRAMCRLSLEPDSCVADTERLFSKFGIRALVFAKFVPGLGAVTTAMSGVTHASLAAFITYDLIGSALWATSGVLIGALFHDAVSDVFAELSALGRIGGMLIVAILVVFLAVKFWRRHQFFQQLRMSRITVQELMRLQAQGGPVLLIDARPAASRARDGMIPGAIAFEALLEAADPIPRGGEAIVYCACPNEATAARVARRLMVLGFHPVRPLSGGIHAWRDAGFNVVQP
jgi:membrane protein DedA with SNARE-associated domain/rhodanese-related sulfurtransferase